MKLKDRLAVITGAASRMVRKLGRILAEVATIVTPETAPLRAKTLRNK